VPPIPSGLPLPVKLGGGQVTISENGQQVVIQEGDVLVPQELDLFIAQRLMYLEQRPRLCQTALDEQKRVLAVECNGVIETMQAGCDEEKLRIESQSQNSLQRWQLIGALAVATALGVGIGIYFGSLSFVSSR